MKESKVLKGFCYVLIPVILLILFISVSYQICKDIAIMDNSPEYFSSDEFLSNYMCALASDASNLIYRNSQYNSIRDGERDFEIYYKQSNSYYTELEEYYYLILYNDLALTNVELTINTNTVEKIKNYIKDYDGKKTNIINGNVQADSELIETKALQYFDNFKNRYYTITENGGAETYQLGEGPEETTESTMYTNKREYYTATIYDFQIYTTYKEIVKPRNDVLLCQYFVNLIQPYENITIPAIPICSSILLLISIYLIISIGHTKDKDGIDLNDFDKIFIELIFIVVMTLAGGCIGLVSLLCRALGEEILNNLNLISSVILAAYLITYILGMLIIVTIIKRIKSKTLINTSLCGKCFVFLIGFAKKITNKIIDKIKTIYNKITKNWNITVKLVVATIIFCLILIFILNVFKFMGIFLDIYLIIFVLYRIILRLECYKKIEKHLKNMYEGKEVYNLNQAEFTKEFKDVVKYINDISNVVENAKQEGIKSERMKTELITNVSHDIKTPLTSIINYVDLLKKEEIENSKAKEYIDVLEGKSQRLKKLTEDLVEASKASSGNVKLNIEKINIIELIKQTTGEFEDIFKDKKLEIISNMPKEEIYVNADSRYMYRIIENLFSNISKYALDSSRVYIDVKSNGIKVKISLKNISKEKLNISAEELMQRFVRGDKSRTTEGSGLGLSISQSLTELQNGTFLLNVDGDLFKVELEFDISK